MHGSHTTALATASLAILALVPVQFTLADENKHNIQKRHVQMVTPQPYVWAEYGPTNPLNPDGSDYPCKVPPGGKFEVDGSPTEMVAGEEQVVSFAGWAVHGGGSCQFALAEGLEPTRDSAWSVIHSVEGGCPKAGAAGNLEAGQAPDNYTFRVPDGFEPGDYTFAWTWVNRIGGQPEFYMNCAPVTVKAGAAAARMRGRRDRGARARARAAATTVDYPDLFLANIGDAGGGCLTSEAWSQQVAIKYPYPGDSVSHPDGTANLFKQPCDGNPRNNGSTSPSASRSAGVAPTSILSGAATGASGATPTGSPSMPGSSAAHTSTSTSSPPHSSASVVSSATTSTASTASSVSSSCTDGYLKCVNGTRFSTCTGGEWTAPQYLASNARCKEEGESVGLQITHIT